jgi:hypothetical protein
MIKLSRKSHFMVDILLGQISMQHQPWLSYTECFVRWIGRRIFRTACSRAWPLMILTIAPAPWPQG